MNVTDLRSLHGRSVLIRSAADRGDPPGAARGTLGVREDADGFPEVFVSVDLPQMFKTLAQHREFVLSDLEVERLVATERGGVFEFTLRDELI